MSIRNKAIAFGLALAAVPALSDAAEVWRPTSTSASGRYRHTAVWTGTRMIVWGGFNSFGRINTGGIYTPPGVPAGPGDFDGDGHDDILWHHQGDGRLYVWFLGGTGGVVTQSGCHLTPSSFSDTNWKVVPR